MGDFSGGIEVYSGDMGGWVGGCVWGGVGVGVGCSPVSPVQ